MKKIIICCVCIGLTMSLYSQDYFQKKIKKVKSLALVSLITKETANFDFTKVSEKTLIIPQYDPKSIYQETVLNEQYDKFPGVEEKNKYYKETWAKGIEESSFDLCNYKFADVDFEEMSEADKKKSLFLSYHETMGYYYVIIWYVSEDNEELPANMLLINDLDLGEKNDLRFLFNIINQSYLVSQDYVNKKMFADMNEILEDDSKPKIERLYTMQNQDVIDAINEYYARLAANYVSEAEFLTLILPEDNKSKGLDEVMTNWTYSKYEYLTQANIEEKRVQLDPNYCYLRLQTAGSGMMASTIAWILSTENDRILYQYLRPISAKDKIEKIIPKLINDIDAKLGLYDGNSTISYQKVDFTSNELPTDLKSSKIAYVNITKQQYPYANWLNKSFERKMKKYLYEFKITDDPNDLSDCKYRVMLKSFMQTYRKVTTTTYVDNSKPVDVDTDYVTKELFYLYLQDTKTGECYKFQESPGFYPYTFKAFVKEVN